MSRLIVHLRELSKEGEGIDIYQYKNKEDHSDFERFE